MSASSSVAVSKKASSLVVAASMSAVEALKDQAGLCRWDYALRSLYNRAAAANKVVVTGRAVPVSLSSSQAAGGSAAASTPAAAAGRAARPRRSEEEKLHKAYHLVCWGPN
ncbi:hypothetical protein BDA96_10G304900 [Sorghum bicolor]|jgi:hypothetical protein|uniref:Wound-responsive family protein n=2 Tax=Sorghum bicolor TaxID=4558 RepID=A0A921Q5D0_SORBI|nr:uncharacterized protein LOC8083309 [Sorghum bicolor]EER90246.1 hypothetical protein SORBI_3010G234600 [Sorghum bicolor]KAG0515748.1 hypothetical protein BDA96_10G304900 [Sorghum bicolor]|eukprot:XP_002438879.1 uncharacterized protein LOC8083309 [Sorghum bicolor]